MKNTSNNKSGFTIVELLVAMAISLVVMGSIYSVYRSQQKSYLVQEQVAVMQQNLRAGMTMLTRDIRMAGYNPPLATNPFATTTLGITSASPNALQFTRFDPVTTTVETISYALQNNDLFRNDDGVNQLVAENIDALNFVYLNQSGTVLDDDGDGNVTANIPNISSIQVTMIARTGRADLGYVNSDVYSNQQGTPVFPSDGNPVNDNFRRRALNREIKCRNLP